MGKIVENYNLTLKENKKSGKYSKEELKEQKKKFITKKRIILATTLVINFGILGFLKYWNTIINTLNLTFLHVGGTKGLLLPLGISFYTFQSISYFMDIYNGKYPCEKKFLRYFLFISFFPQLIMGPINRYNELGMQIKEEHSFNFENIKKGSLLILFGSMKKYCIADLLVQRISNILDYNYPNLPGSFIIIGILSYSIYQYADFSGGIDMVRGFSQLFGLEMATNFRQPYFSVSLGDFWRRWHISLGLWMKDYIFYPFALTKTMQNVSKKMLNLKNKAIGKHFARTIPAGLGNIIVFLFVGIWHGPEMHFVIWGLYNGLVIAFSDLFKPVFEKIRIILHIQVKSFGFKLFQICRTFFIVNIGWYFDRIVNVKKSFLYLGQSFFNFGSINYFKDREYLKLIFGNLRTIESELVIIFFAGFIVFITSIIKERKINLYEYIQKKNIAFRWSCYYIPMILILFSLSFSPETPGFMYAQY